MKMRKAYRQAVDGAKVPDKLAQATLAKMLEENRRLQVEADAAGNAKDAGREAFQSAGRRTVPRIIALASLAAVLVVAFGIGAFVNQSRQTPFYLFQLSALPRDAAQVRGDEAPVPSLDEFAALMGFDPNAMIPGYTLSDGEVAYAYDAPSKAAGQVATLNYKNGGSSATLVAASFDTVLMAAIKRGEAVRTGDLQIHLGRDTDSGVLYAAWTLGAAHFLMESASLDEGAFVDLAKDTALRRAP